MVSLNYNLPRGFVQARNPEHGAILIGGLGALGVGAMWKPETDDDRTRDGYEDAPVQAMHPNDVQRVELWQRGFDE